MSKYMCVYACVCVQFRTLAAKYYHLSGHINRINDILLPTARLVIVSRNFHLLTLLLLLGCHVNFAMKTTFNTDIRNGRMSTVFRKRVQHLPTAPLHISYQTTTQLLLINKIEHFHFKFVKFMSVFFFQHMHAFSNVDCMYDCKTGST